MIALCKRGLTNLPRKKLLPQVFRCFSNLKDTNEFVKQSEGMLVVDENAGLEKRAIVRNLRQK